jgi:hypothetical protein
MGSASELRKVWMEELISVLGPISPPKQFFQSQKGSPFNVIAPGWDGSGPATSCPTLPAYIDNKVVRRMLGSGYPKKGASGITGKGLYSALVIALTVGAWVDADSQSKRPKPGDIFLFTGDMKGPPDGDYMKYNPNILHIGIVCNAEPGLVNANGQPIWITADAGLGPRKDQACGYCERTISFRDKFWILEGNYKGKAPPEGVQGAAKKRVLGWVDLDKMHPHLEKVASSTNPSYSRLYSPSWYGKGGTGGKEAIQFTLRKRIRDKQMYGLDSLLVT